MRLEPKKFTREARREVAAKTAEAVTARFGSQVWAIVLYGSVASGRDQAYSDVELKAVVEGIQETVYLAWVENGLKVSVEIGELASFLRKAKRVEDDWPLSHTEYTRFETIFGDERIGSLLREAAGKSDDKAFDAAVRELFIGNLFEYAAKSKAAYAEMNHGALVRWGFEFVNDSALMFAIAARRPYERSATMWEEACNLPELPQEVERLLRRYIAGDLSKSDGLIDDLDAAWLAIADWAMRRGIHIAESANEALEEPVL